MADHGRRWVVNEVSVLWAEHRGSAFPDDLHREDDAGVDVPYLDAVMAGCVSVYVAGHGALDPERRQIMRDSASDLRALAPRLRGEGASYVARLVRMADLMDQT